MTDNSFATYVFANLEKVPLTTWFLSSVADIDKENTSENVKNWMKELDKETLETLVVTLEVINKDVDFDTNNEPLMDVLCCCAEISSYIDGYVNALNMAKILLMLHIFCLSRLEK